MPFGLFEYLFTPFGLSNATQTFQRMMDRTMDGLEGVFAYMDDSCVGSPDRQTHLPHLEAFFTALVANGLAINLEKCVFATSSLEILGHKISVTGAAPMADRAAEIENCPPPQDIKQLQRFLGMVNFYRCFLPNCAQVLKPLADLLKGGAKTFEWTVSAQEAFQEAKRLLAAAVPLQHPAPNASFPWPLTPPIPISEGSCNKNQETIGGHLVSFPVNSQTRNLTIQLLIAIY
jgi:hypothetical protein